VQWAAPKCVLTPQDTSHTGKRPVRKKKNREYFCPQQGNKDPIADLVSSLAPQSPHKQRKGLPKSKIIIEEEEALLKERS